MKKRLLYFALILTACLFLTVDFLSQGSLYLPFDDSYISLSFARNMYRYHAVEYNQGELSTGITCPLFSFLVALVYSVTGNWPVASLVVGFASLLLAATAGGFLCLQLGSRMACMVFVAVFLCSGRMLFHALMGMECMLYAALGLGTFWALLKNRGMLWGCLLGLMYLARPDAVFLVPPVFLYVLLGRRFREFFTGAICSFAVVLPWVVTCLVDNGTFLPNAVLTKMHSGDHAGLLIQLYRWLFLTNMFGASYEGMVSEEGAPFSLLTYVQSCIPLLGISMVVLRLKKARELWVLYAGSALQFLCALVISSGYVLAEWHRYATLNYAMTFIGLSVLSAHIVETAVDCRKALRVGAAAFAIVMCLILQDALWQAKAYRFLGSYFHRLDGQIGIWLAGNTPPGTRVGLIQAGAIKYYSDRYVVDFAGLISLDDYRKARKEGPLQVVVDKHLDYIAPFSMDFMKERGVRGTMDRRYFTRVEIPGSRGLAKVNKEALAQVLLRPQAGAVMGKD